MKNYILALLFCSLTTACKPNISGDGFTSYPHDPNLFTQGFEINDGIVVESSGLYGKSLLRRYTLSTGKLINQVKLPGHLFAEGLTQLNGSLYLLTWKAGIAQVYDSKSLTKLKTINYSGQGWGLTNNGSQLIMSNGSHKLVFRDPNNFEIKRAIDVFENGKAIRNLNELEWVKGKIYANIWNSSDVVIISPTDGKVLQRINLQKLHKAANAMGTNQVLNGIAYDKANQKLYVTGKNWPLIFELPQL